jgi:serine protease Do
VRLSASHSLPPGGIVSYVDRDMGFKTALVQTDTAINHGNSGGPLFDLDGKLVGINAMMATPSEEMQGSVGLNFAIGLSQIRTFLSRFKGLEVVE